MLFSDILIILGVVAKEMAQIVAKGWAQNLGSPFYDKQFVATKSAQKARAASISGGHTLVLSFCDFTDETTSSGMTFV